MSLLGRTKFTLLKMLKNSARNCRFTFSWLCGSGSNLSA